MGGVDEPEWAVHVGRGLGRDLLGDGGDSILAEIRAVTGGVKG
jgi:hypothetical protein